METRKPQQPNRTPAVLRGNGIETPHLFEEGSEGLMHNEQANPPGYPPGDPNRAVSGKTRELLARLSDTDLKAVLKYYRDNTAQKETERDKDTGRLAAFLVNAPSESLVVLCALVPALSTDAFFEALFADVYPDIYETFSEVAITDRIKDFHDAYRPQRADMTGRVLKGKKKVYHFWEQLYYELDVFTVDQNKRKLLEAVWNDSAISSKESSVFLSYPSYPFLSLFLGVCSSYFTQEVIIANDSLVYKALDIPDGRLYGDFFRTIEEGKPTVLSLLLADSRVDPTAEKNKAIRRASHNGHAEIVRLLLADKRVDPAADNNEAIRYASMSGHAEVVRLLLAEPRVNPSAEENEAIRYASQKGHAEVVKLLLADGRADPAAKDNKAIREASRYGHAEVVKLLLAEGRADPTAWNNDAIRDASRFNCAEVVKLLLAEGRADPTAWKNYAIRKASSRDHAEVVKLLLADGRADPAAENNQAIRNASEYGHAEVVKLLLAEGRVDPTAEDNDAIREASRRGRVEVVKLLLADGRADSRSLF